MSLTSGVEKINPAVALSQRKI